MGLLFPELSREVEIKDYNMGISFLFSFELFAAPLNY